MAAVASLQQEEKVEDEEAVLWAALIPSSHDEDIHEIEEPWPALSVKRKVLAVLEEKGRASLCVAEARGGGTFYWKVHSNAPVNERVVAALGISDVRGDVVFVGPTPGSYHPLISPKSREKRERLSRLRSRQSIGDGSSRSLSAKSAPILDAPANVLQTIFSRLNFTDISSCSQVCKPWRQLIGDDEVLLSSLSIRRRAATSSSCCGSSCPVGSGGETARHRACASVPHKHDQSLPFVLSRGAEWGNVAAMALVGTEMYTRGEMPKALEWWRKAARRGHQESQLRVGEMLYLGGNEMARDPEEALVWLLRAARNPNGEPALLAKAALLLGYLYMDGDGMQRPDNTEAIKWLKVAARHGSREAEKTIGWLWNTGQY